jgi:hypothetical protein
MGWIKLDAQQIREDKTDAPESDQGQACQPAEDGSSI